MKVRIAIFFSIIFVSLIVTPTIISLMDASQDVSYFYNFNEEEEENNGKEESKVDSKLKVHSSSFLNTILAGDFQVNKNIRFYSKNYISKYSKVTTPPPKFVL
ncbi:hypothetical protein JL193_08390 [Polaribacter batillariae]|uniref:Uncharacterized protein n=1 Tax=Polaribacter batillariae TaxID=2808900 RepID=A0ABX7SRX9_9FLAO|nr:hypothetical protein [Polaribacter batillariae]QTD36188.1 hypothetical protein JL193_08390 [Polaribacter batillariae]